MKLYIFRHAHSPSLTEAGVSRDAERPISKQGREDIIRQAQQLSAKGASPDIILTSPLKRAMQTAEQISLILKPKAGVKIFGPLANQIHGEALVEELRQETANIPELLIVGHQPQLGEMVTQLTGQTIDLRPGGAVLLDIKKDGRASLLWSQNP